MDSKSFSIFSEFKQSQLNYCLIACPARLYQVFVRSEALQGYMPSGLCFARPSGRLVSWQVRLTCQPVTRPTG